LAAGGAGDAGETTTTTPETIELEVYLIRDGQLVYTLTQFPGVQSVEVVGGVSTRALERLDFEEFAPAILVESPLTFVVFERSANDGSRINLVEIPLRMSE
jgi:hypothetical protein